MTLSSPGRLRRTKLNGLWVGWSEGILTIELRSKGKKWRLQRVPRQYYVDMLRMSDPERRLNELLVMYTGKAEESLMQHYTRNTVEASSWCAKCGKDTMHRIDGVKVGPCLACVEKQEKQMELPRVEVAKQDSLFGDSIGHRDPG